MAREIKALSEHIKAIEGRKVTGIFSVFGNVDSYGDIMLPGSFTKTVVERGAKTLHLWQHSFDCPPTAKIDNLREIGRDELPDAIIRDFPSAMGGMEVTRTYLDTPRANEVLANLQASVPLQMSFAYDAVKFDFGELDGRPVRYLREVRLYETSDVNWGANDATVASKANLTALMQGLQLLAQQAKAGQRHSAADIEMLNQIHDLAYDLGCTGCIGKVSSIGKADEFVVVTERKTQDPVSVTGLWLRASSGKADVLAEIGGEWKLVISEAAIDADSVVSHIAEPKGISEAPIDPITAAEQEAESRAAEEALTRKLNYRRRSLDLKLKLLGGTLS